MRALRNKGCEKQTLTHDCKSPSALCRGPVLNAKTCKDSLCKVAAVCVSGPGAFCRSLCRGLAVIFRLCLCRGPSLCVGARRSLCRGPVFLASGPGALCPGSASGPPNTFFSRYRRSVLGLPLTVCLSRPNALCVGARCSLCRALALFMSGPGGPLPALFLSGPAVCVGARRGALCGGPARLLSVGAWRSLGPALFVSGPGAPCAGSGVGIGAQPKTLFSGYRRSVLGLACRGPTICVSGPGALCVGAALLVSGPGAPYELFFASGPGAVGGRRWGGRSRRSVCRVPVLSVAVCVGARRSWPCLCRGPALCVRARCSLYRGPALLATGPGALCRRSA